MTKLRLLSLVLAGIFSVIGCDAAPQDSADEYVVKDRFAETAAADQAEATGAGSERERDEADFSEQYDGEDTQSPDRQLVYTAELVLAIFDVTAIQEEAIDLVESIGGYVSRRSSKQLVLRVPAAKFRATLDELSELGDVLELNWQAQDVTDKVRDIEIRIQNARELRGRLEDLLERADTVKDALEIEAELERITLEIERLEGELESFEDRIAYSTIEMNFDPKRIEEMPDDEFLLPVAWINDLSVESLLEAPEHLR